MHTASRLSAIALALAMAGAAGAGDEPTASRVGKPGRYADEEAVKAGGATDRVGRSAEVDPEMALSDRDKPGHAIEGEAVEAGGDAGRPGRGLDDD